MRRGKEKKSEERRKGMKTVKHELVLCLDDEKI